MFKPQILNEDDLASMILAAINQSTLPSSVQSYSPRSSHSISYWDSKSIGLSYDVIRNVSWKSAADFANCFIDGNQLVFRANERQCRLILGLDVSSSSEAERTKYDFTDWSIVLFALLIVISVVTSVGNGLVLYVLVRNKSLHSPSNLFIGSLACADLIIGAFVMPVASYYFVLNDNTWNLGLPVCQLWLSLDYFATCSSILNLMAMSLDRYFSIAHALSYRQYRNYRNFLAAIALIWTLSSIYTPPILLWHHIFNQGVRTIPPDKCDVEFATEMNFKVVSLLLSFILPFCTMCIVYLRIFIVIHQRTQKSKKRHTSTSSYSRNDVSSSINPKSPRIRQTPPKLTREATIYEIDDGGADADDPKGRVTTKTSPSPNTGVRISDKPPTAIEPSGSSEETNGKKRSGSGELAKNGASTLSKVQRRISTNINMIRRKRSTEQQREPHFLKVKAAKQLAFILLAFAICWLPYMTIYMGYATEAPIFQSDFSITFFTLSVWLGYMNSFLNPILYPLCIDSFKKAFRELYKGKHNPHLRGATPTSIPASRRVRRMGRAGPPPVSQAATRGLGRGAAVLMTTAAKKKSSAASVDFAPHLNQQYNI
ncbi:5-hydroxytryptamine receptor 1D-like isoform X3 [Symsagittifera roscoffensis]|uniref:5-hydroxytryptamine receptor 1D-like isoform X3 n=1 Tax=Symsagittifera roscoffensis TaxID=84072 RepID=UPI00307C5BC6